MGGVDGAARTYWLSMHVPYACRHAGACCAAGWPIPIERVRADAVASLRSPRAWLRVVQGAPEDVAGVLAVSESGRCVFRGERCEIHGALGHAALPSACQHFPRRVRLDPRGVFVTLSHYCPTAAELLFTHTGPVEIVEGPPGLPAGEPEGLDARDVLPPLLRAGQGHISRLRGGARSRVPVPGLVRQGQVSRAGARSRAEGSGLARRQRVLPMLMDWDGYYAWERHLVHVLANCGLVAEVALGRLEADLRNLQSWRPSTRSLSSCIVELTATAPEASGTGTNDLVLGRYLAARAFAAWSPFGADGVAAAIAELRTALAGVRARQRQHTLREAIRQTDYELLHTRSA